MSLIDVYVVSITWKWIVFFLKNWDNMITFSSICHHPSCIMIILNSLKSVDFKIFNKCFLCQAWF